MDAVSVMLLAWAAGLAACDLLWRRIPNWALVLALLPAAITLGISSHGPLGVDWLPSLGGAGLATALLLPAYSAGWLGAGDVKFSALLGLLLGPVPVGAVLLLSALVLGAGATVVLLLRRGRGHGLRLAAAPAIAAGLSAVLVSASLF